MDKVISLARKFKDDVLLPVSAEGVLDKDTLEEILEMYVQELRERTNPEAPVIIETEGKFSELHPSTAGPIKLDGKEWPTIEHYRLAADFFETDEELVEHIREAKTTVVAKRRYENALLNEVKPRFNHEELREGVLKTAYSIYFHAHPEILSELKATGKVPILFQGTNDTYLGIRNGKEGYNAVGKVLMILRKELN